VKNNKLTCLGAQAYLSAWEEGAQWSIALVDLIRIDRLRENYKKYWDPIWAIYIFLTGISNSLSGVEKIVWF